VNIYGFLVLYQGFKEIHHTGHKVMNHLYGFYVSSHTWPRKLDISQTLWIFQTFSNVDTSKNKLLLIPSRILA